MLISRYFFVGVVALAMVFSGIESAFAEGVWVADRETGCEAWIASDAGLAPYFRGTATDDKRSFTWSGACKAGKLDGMGLMQIFEGVLLRTYEGPFVSGHQTGRGIEIWYPGSKSQSSYEGDFVDGSRHGMGKKIWDSGIRYEGEWKNDLRHGKGVTTWPSGKVEAGRYQDNVYVGQ